MLQAFASVDTSHLVLAELDIENLSLIERVVELRIRPHTVCRKEDA